MEISLYNRNLTTPIFDTDLTFSVQRLRFSTKLHGGFSICTFSLKAGLPYAWEWITSKILYRVVITDNYKTLWEGRVQDVGIESGLVEVTAYGYHASLNDQIYKTAYNADADVVIKAMITAAAPMINTEGATYPHIAATGGPAIDSAADTDYLDRSLKILIEKLAGFGDDAGNQWYFAIWEDRKPWFFQRSVSSVDWTVNLSDLARFKLRHSSKDLWNKVYALYDGGAETADFEDATSQTKYGITRYYAIPELGTVGGAGAAAIAAAKRWLAEHKDIWPSLEDITLGDRVYDTNGVPFSSSRVRAGDVLRVLDLVPVSGDLDAATRDALRTYYIIETDYNADILQNSITIDTDRQALTSIIAKLM